MEETIDRIIAILDELREEDDFYKALQINAYTKFDDPGIVVVDEYPYMFVAPIAERPRGETMGRAGYDIYQLGIQIGVVINQADYWDSMVPEVSGTRELIQASALIRRRLRRFRNRQLEGVEGARNLSIQTVNYVPDVRDGTFVKAALMDIIVERQYPNEE
jgi:hypothetical protein